MEVPATTTAQLWDKPACALEERHEGNREAESSMVEMAALTTCLATFSKALQTFTEALKKHTRHQERSRKVWMKVTTMRTLDTLRANLTDLQRQLETQREDLTDRIRYIYNVSEKRDDGNQEAKSIMLDWEDIAVEDDIEEDEDEKAEVANSEDPASRSPPLISGAAADPGTSPAQEAPNKPTKGQRRPTTQIWLQSPARLQNPYTGEMMRMPLSEDLKQMLTELQDHTDWFEPTDTEALNSTISKGVTSSR